MNISRNWLLLQHSVLVHCVWGANIRSPFDSSIFHVCVLMSEQRFCYHSSELTHDTISSRFLADSCLYPRLSAPFPPPAVLLRVPSDLSSTAPPPPAFRNTETSAASCRRGFGHRSGAARPGCCMEDEAGGAGPHRGLGGDPGKPKEKPARPQTEADQEAVFHF